MANDPNRDLLPVKESMEKASCEHIDPHLVARFKRSELEDRYIRLYEENNDLKKLTNIQETKIKKLGTKLLRVLEEKKIAPYSFKRNEPSDDDLQRKLVELEHENYALRDKNTVLRQQLASHCRQHMAAHRSPVRVGSTPRLSQRQASVPNINEGSYTLSNRRNSTEMQLRDAEAHIAAMNEEMKALHSQIESLQHEHERATLKAQQVQVSENIEVIKLKRQNKQFESQMKVFEQTHKALQQDVVRLQKENEDALQIVNGKQKEILDIQCKLDQALQIKLDVRQLKAKVTDLTRERDILQERCDSLLKTVSEKNSEDKIGSSVGVQKELAEVRAEYQMVRQQLEMLKEQNLHLQLAASSMRTHEHSTQTEVESQINGGSGHLSSRFLQQFQSINESEPYDILKSLAKYRTGADFERGNTEESKKEARKPPEVDVKVTDKNNSNMPSSSSNLKTFVDSVVVAEIERDVAKMPVVEKLGWLVQTEQPEDEVGKSLASAAERLDLRRELDSLRDMMKLQSQRCDEQETEIRCLQQEMKLKEERYNDVCQQRDLFLRLFENGNSSKSDQQKSSPKRNGSHINRSKTASECESERSETDRGGEVKKNGMRSMKNGDGPGTYTKNSPTGALSKSNSLVHIEPQVVIMPANTSKPVESSREEGKRVLETASVTAAAAVPKPKPRSASSAREKAERTVSVASTVADKTPVSKEPIEIKLLIMWLGLEEGSRLLEDPNISSLYVDFTFLSKTNETYETPKALPKPADSKSRTTYNYKTDVMWTEEMVESLREVQAKNGDVVVFNIVSEPDAGEEEEVQCPVVGVSSISFYQFAFVDPDNYLTLPIYEVGKERKLCGTLAVKLIMSPSVFGEIQKSVS